ncbi:twin-arginine translocation signal domain-containing protein [Halorussus sp. MSC15.2]|uniref:twin-arginine translocation signal domain-containing protein n=1 Tax=Halorussus sp. MSC15.2 TaxID=2283638 RepID=UPI0013D0B20E|nr:twin-arginine translocation signal domain-containing protein [Halorussus sp. MSC15.2]NEU57844.1 twin-arginine translocation signal domain-containing protein [Halorussus sp. MSC15.2]
MSGNNGNEGRDDEQTGSRRRFLKRVGGAGVAVSFGASVPKSATAAETSESQSSVQNVVPVQSTGRTASVNPEDVPRADESDYQGDFEVPTMLTMSPAEYRRIQERVQRGDFPQPPESAVQRVPRENGGDGE